MRENQKAGAKVYTTEKERSKGMGVKPISSDNNMDMREMAARTTRHHLEPVPAAHPPAINPFPTPVLSGLAGGAVFGIVVGVIWAFLQLRGLVAVSGWEGLYSMTPFTFYVFWAVIGMALFGLFIGVITLHTTPAADRPFVDDVQDKRYPSE